MTRPKEQPCAGDRQEMPPGSAIADGELTSEHRALQFSTEKMRWTIA